MYVQCFGALNDPLIPRADFIHGNVVLKTCLSDADLCDRYGGSLVWNSRWCEISLSFVDLKFTLYKGRT